MKLKTILVRALSFGLPPSVLAITYIVLSPKTQDSEWLAMLAGMMCLLFVVEAVKPLFGEELTWMALKPLDKIIAAICLCLQIIAFLYPFKEGMPIVALILFLVSYWLTWITINKFGSDEMKKRLLWPKP